MEIGCGRRLRDEKKHGAYQRDTTQTCKQIQFPVHYQLFPFERLAIYKVYRAFQQQL
ncbi:hypothetical protein DESC_720321 [Desulfosarcina cetonica]|nr:hypothetical protein DESC_720321 [Desulfosarcina cetonica]